MIRWSLPAWVIIHGLALSYNDTIKEEWKSKMNDISLLIICGYCSKHYNTFKADYMIQNPDYLDSASNAFKYTVDLHNSVNQKLDKPILSFNEAVVSLSNFTANKRVGDWISEFHIFFFSDFLLRVRFNSEEHKQELIKKLEDFFIFIKTHVSDEVFESSKTFHASI
jgi:hypothetical protein